MTYLSDDVEIVDLLSDADDNDGPDEDQPNNDGIAIDIEETYHPFEKSPAVMTNYEELIELDEDSPPDLSETEHDDDNENDNGKENEKEHEKELEKEPEKEHDNNDDDNVHHEGMDEVSNDDKPTSRKEESDGSHAVISSQRPGNIQQPPSDDLTHALEEMNKPVDDVHHVTGVDGKGLWRSWKRNFKTSLMAIMDLVDNALDAAIPTVGEKNQNFVGRVHVFPDVFRNSTTGLCLLNNSAKIIRPLVEVLRVYDSSKIDSGAGDIGENGVGLKQGCATLTDLSFVLSKNGGNDEIELGIIAKSLQKKEGCYLPSFKFSNVREYGQSNLRNQMFTTFSQPKHRDSAACIARYGGANSLGSSNLEAGIDRLCRHFDRICYNFYDNPYVFSVVLDKVTHLGQSQSGKGKDEDDNDASENVRVAELLEELKRDIAFMYLHIPDNFDLCIDGESVSFKYWTERLVEFSTFAVRVGKTRPWKETIANGDPDAYELNILLGFDRMRVSTKHSRNEASLYIYSRQSGRLIKYIPDCRHELCLQTGGTTFCSGLTVILDDIRGHLPLNPTKQDIAFGEESFGKVHKENLFQWIGAVAHFYYNRHLAKFKLKRDLTNAIKKLGKSNCPQPLKSCDNAVLSTYDNIVFKNYRGFIRADHQMRASCHVGCDTYFRLEAPNPPPLSNIQTHSGRKSKQTDRLVDQKPAAKRSKMNNRKNVGKSAKRSKQAESALQSVPKQSKTSQLVDQDFEHAKSRSKRVPKSSEAINSDYLSSESSIAETSYSSFNRRNRNLAAQKSPSLVKPSTVAQNNGCPSFHDIKSAFETNDKIAGINSRVSDIVQKSEDASDDGFSHHHDIAASPHESPSASTFRPRSPSPHNEVLDFADGSADKQRHNDNCHHNDYKYMYQELRKKYKESKRDVHNLKKKLKKEKESHALTKQQAKRIIEVIKRK
ncbi:hypothetical protein ACHAXS_013289 [Conticribra weissflogii]